MVAQSFGGDVEVYREALHKYLLLKRSIDSRNTRNFKKMPVAGGTVADLRSLRQKGLIAEEIKKVETLRPSDFSDSQAQTILMQEMTKISDENHTVRLRQQQESCHIST